ncbi:MAG TPA: DUF5668 domain-containing protein [Terriglobales bacterium]|nr:DUF5668 domain-containing protein [Terriglobales bacterium]
MDEKIVIQQKPPKSPAAAGILSALIPGVGNMYNGLVNKGLLQLVIFGGLFVIFLQGCMTGSALTIVFMALMMAGFWFYQIIDSVNSAKAINEGAAGQKPQEAAGTAALPPAVTAGSVFWGIILIVIGVLAILANFDVINWDDLWRFSPVLFIVLGAWLVFRSAPKKNGREEK